MSFQCLRLTPGHVSGNSGLPNQEKPGSGFSGIAGKIIARQKIAIIGYTISAIADISNNGKAVFIRPGRSDPPVALLARERIEAAFFSFNSQPRGLKMVTFTDLPTSQKSVNQNEQHEKIISVLRKQKVTSHAINEGVDALHFLANILTTASKYDDAVMDYPEINGLGLIMELLKDFLDKNANCNMPFVCELETLFGVKLESGK